MIPSRFVGLLALVISLPVGRAGEVTYNGLRPPSPWPPRLTIGAEPMSVPYLTAPPAVVLIDVGRQLFVDDFLIEATDLVRTHHRGVYHPATPVVWPDKPWEITPPDPCAMEFSDGVWYDPKDRVFKM
jgi:hypothetical protein